MSDTYSEAERLFPARGEQVDAKRSAAQHNPAPSETPPVVVDQAGLPLTLRDGLPISPSPSAKLHTHLMMKRVVLDIPLAILALVCLAPLLALVALAIRLSSPGPVLFTQRRVGLDGAEFSMLKFRTMRTEDCDHSGHSQVVENDDRLTELGRLLRATSIDELPQLFNILAGDMSIIGPRPMVPGMRAAGADFHDVVPYYEFRHRMRPGLSGWAQANGLRGPTADLRKAKQRIDHDCAYIQNFSFTLDIKIIIRTVVREFLTGSGV